MSDDANMTPPLFKSWQGGRPSTFPELFTFYHGYVKPLYAEVQTENELPQEMLFELNAALDHIARRWTYNEDEKSVVEKAFSHLKRACLDVFKIRLVKAVDQHKRLFAHDLSAIDNGDFVKDLNVLFARIQKTATLARQKEGIPETGSSIPAFELWEAVFLDCIELEERFLLHRGVNWALRLTDAKKAYWRQHAHGFLVGVMASIVAAIICLFLLPASNQPSKSGEPNQESKAAPPKEPSPDSHAAERGK